MRIPRIRTTGRTLLASGLALAALAMPAIPASAAGETQVSGVGTPDVGGVCTDFPGSPFVMVMTGDLTGCWYNHGWLVDKFTPSGAYSEHGTETFVGCYATVCGSFDTTYTFTGKYAPDGAEIFGRCQHPLVSGTGGFAGLTGRVHFKDDVTTGTASYQGHFKLP